MQGGVVMCAYASVTAEKETGVESSGLLSKVLFFSDARAFCLEEVYTSLYHARLYIYIYIYICCLNDCLQDVICIIYLI